MLFSLLLFDELRMIVLSNQVPCRIGWLQDQVISRVLSSWNFDFQNIIQARVFNDGDRLFRSERPLSVQFSGSNEIIVSLWLIDTPIAQQAKVNGHLLVDGAEVSTFLGDELFDEALAHLVFVASVKSDMVANLLEPDVLHDQPLQVHFKSHL